MSRRPNGGHQDFYEVLGVPRNVNDAELKRAYRQKAIEHHPDKNPGRVQEATEAFKLIGEAYAVLRDPHLRADYDSNGCVSGHGTCDQTFNISTAMDLFKDVLGEEFAAGLARVADSVAPKVQAVTEPLTSAIANAVDCCSKSDVMREAMRSGLDSIAADAEVEVQDLTFHEEECIRKLDECNTRLREHSARYHRASAISQSRLDHASRQLLVVILQMLGISAVVIAAVAWMSIERLPLWVVVVLILTMVGMALRALKLWGVFAAERAAKLLERDKELKAGSSLKMSIRRAKHNLLDARERVGAARAKASQARGDLMAAERDGASFGGMWRVGLHFINRATRGRHRNELA